MNEAGKREQQTEKDKIDLFIQKGPFCALSPSLVKETNGIYFLLLKNQEGKKRRNKKENTIKEEGQ